MTYGLRHLRFVLPAIAILVTGCLGPASASDDATEQDVAATAGHDDHAGHSGVDLDDGPEMAVDDMGSLFDLGTRWLDQDGSERTLADVGGRPLVVAMVYTTCTHTCPLILADLKQVEDRLTPSQRDSVGFVLVSLDPERDTPAQLSSFAQTSRLDLSRWTLLTGQGTDVRMLAASLGVRYRPGTPGEIDHTNALTVLDADGSIAYQQRGVADGTDAVVRALVALLR